MIETGIPKLDEYLGGGIPLGKSLVYYNQPGVEGEVFGMQTMYHNLKKGGTCIYVASSSSPKTVKDQFKEYGWNLGSFGERIKFIDAYSQLIGAPTDAEYLVSNPNNIESLTSILEKAVEDLEMSCTLIFSSLSTIMDLCGENETLAAIQRWNDMGKENHVIIYNFTAWPYSEETLNRIKGDLFNGVISIGGIAERVIFGQYFGVLKADWTKTVYKSMLFRVLRPGGIRLYIPKILVTGPYSAGKTTFVHALSAKATSVDRLGTTVALDHGYVDYKGFSADVFGTPGQERFDPIIKLLSGEAMGVFLVVDSTSLKDFIRAKKMLEITKAYGLPHVIIANKQDVRGALKPEKIREKFNIPEDVPIVPAIAKEGVGVYEAFEVLIDKITRS